MPIELNKNYDPAEVEARWYAWWEEQGLFHAEADEEGEPYSIVIPPPNVTGRLHMGHALNNTLQDVLIRWQRMQGKRVSWIPGTDHASISTEGKVVNQLAEQGIRKEDLTREAFLEHAWAWKEEYGGIIIEQLRKLGCSCDWERERFTMDEGYSRAVLAAFVQLFEKGLIYRGNRLVNWCPKQESAISDEEVIHREVNGNLWHFRYPVIGEDTVMVVATTRPETMLGDTAVAVNPGDERYQHLVGKTVKLPLVGREIPIIADAYVDPAFGTGCVKITPAHDLNDFAMGERHGLKAINIMNEDASLNDNVPEPYRGLSREEGRKKVVADLDAQGLLEKVEPHQNKVGYSERGGVPIEFFLSEQWYMKMESLAKPALQVVRDGTVKIHPEHWVKTYEHWMENIRDWCISRQLWWGHRIPVWYRKGADRSDAANWHVSVDGPDDPENWEQDEDVLDTWASSWLWPFAVHTWPAESADEAAFYPTAVLLTGPDILFFWVARMIMAGLEFKGEVPFSDVYLHGIVRNADGAKMSKSLGNSLDPLDIVERYSADALRFSIIMLTATGQDVYVSDEKFELGRNFGTKIWNAARYMGMHTKDESPDFLAPSWDPALLRADDRQILAKLHRAIAQCQDHLEKLRFNDSAKAIYEFLWHHFCDWYVEGSKDVLYGEDTAERRAVLQVMHHVFSNALRLLHPLMPFLTEELWHGMGYASAAPSIMKAPWPEALPSDAWGVWGDTETDEAYVDDKHAMIRAARTLRADYGLNANRDVAFVLKPTEDPNGQRAAADTEHTAALLKAGGFTADANFTPASAMPSALTPLGTVYMPLEGLVDVAEELAKLRKQVQEVEGFLKGIAKKLDNEQFTSRAPAEVVEQQRVRHGELVEKREKLNQLIDSLG